jgi:hypothetical protein
VLLIFTMLFFYIWMVWVLNSSHNYNIYIYSNKTYY